MTTNTSQTLDAYQMLVGGEWVDASDGGHINAVSPVNQVAWATAPAATDEDVDRAVRAAREAFERGPWSGTTPAERAAVLRRLGDLIAENAEEITRIQVQENGKLMREMLGQTKGLAGHCCFYAGLAESIHGHTPRVSMPNMFTYTQREPVGVVAAITPWNSPLALLIWKLGPALAVGCTVVVKPSEVTPISTLVLARLVEEAGVPSGVFNVVTGASGPGRALVEHPDVDKIAFTGSPDAGRSIAQAAGAHLTRVSLELGGKSPNILFADADLDNAVNGVLAGVFAATGQTCLAGSRALIHESIYDEVAARLAARSESLRLGDPFDPETEMGPVACKPQYDKVMHYIDVATSEGAKLLAGGVAASEPPLSDGLYLRPTVFGDVTNDMRIAREEVFGPVVCLLRFSTEDQAVEIANDTSFGLAAGVWTRNLQLAHRVSSRLRAGTVWVNTYRKTDYAMPFGGYKDSGLGRENGFEALLDYTETKAVWVDTGNTISDPFNPHSS